MDIMDAYCERVGPGLLAEPLNAVSNVSFLLAAWAAWVLATRTGTLSTGVRVLIALAASSLRWYREYPVAHVPNVVDADSRYCPNPNFRHVVHLALCTKCYRDALTIRCCVCWSVPVGNLCCHSIFSRSPWSPRLCS